MRILFVNSHLIGEKSATGDTLKNIFSNIPDMEILEYTLFPRISGKVFLGLTSLETISNKRTNLLNEFIHNYHQKSLKSNMGFSGETNVSWKSKLKLKLKKSALMWNELLSINFDKECLAKIKDFSPDVIYTLATDINVLRNSIALSDLFDIPIVVHNMDDLYHTKFNGSSFVQKYARNKYQSLYKEVYKRSRKSLAIGPKMAKEYRGLFGLPFDWAMNCTKNTQDSCDPEENLLIFSGGLHGGRISTLLNLAKALEGTSIKFEIYTDDRNFVSYQSDFSCFKNTAFMRYVPKSQMFDNLSRAKILIHVESFEQKYMDYFRLSMSTKIPEYLSVKRPILCIGPKDIATVEFIDSQKVGIAVSDDSDVLNVIRDLLFDSAEYDLLKINTEKTLYENFTLEKIQSKIRDVFKYNVEHYSEDK